MKCMRAFLRCVGRMAMIVFLGALAPGIPTAFAATKTFDGGGTNGATLDLAANWNPDVIPVTGDEALLDNTSFALPATLTLSVAETFGDLLVNSTTLTNISLTGGSSQNITLSGGGGSTAAITAGGAANDLLLLGSGVHGAVTVGGGSGTGKLGLALGTNGNFNVANADATLAISGILSGNYNLTKTGAGTLTLSGVNTHGGAGKTNTLSAGTLNINNVAALGNAANVLVINDGATLDNTSGAALTTGNYPLTLNGNFSFSGTTNLAFGAGATTLGTAPGASRTITANAGTLTLGGVIGNGTTATNLIKAGNGALTLASASTFTGGVTLNAGILNINNAGVAGTSGPLGKGGPFTIAGGTIDNTSGSALVLLNTNAVAVNGDFAFTGLASGTHDLTLPGAVTQSPWAVPEPPALSPPTRAR